MTENKLIIDASNATLGRLASYVAKQALQGKNIIIVHSERAIITGKKKNTVENYQIRRRRGGSSQKGPKMSKDPSRILKRAIRGMLPDHRKGRGKEAFKRILCYKGIPEKYKEEKMIKAGKEKHTTYMNLEQLSKKL